MEGTENKNGSGLAKFLNQLNGPTLIAIVAMGGGNFLATKTSSDEQRQVVFRQIRDLHDALDEFEQRQKQILKNQTQMLENQAHMLEQISKQHSP
jgi:hypothetical protein